MARKSRTSIPAELTIQSRITVIEHNEVLKGPHLEPVLCSVRNLTSPVLCSTRFLALMTEA